MDHVSNLDIDLAEALPSAHEIEAAGQVPFDFGRALDVEPAVPEQIARLDELVETGEFTAVGDALEGPVREPFGAWLLKQKNRGDWIDDLASAARKDPVFPKRGDVDQVRDRLKALGADGDAYEALDDAELNWLAR